jgi:alanyl-tRNA synthetase
VPETRRDTYAMNVTETTRTFLEFFGDRGHQVVPGSSLVPPQSDPVLFTTAGMHPLTRYLEGRPHPQGRRLAACSAACAPPIWTRSAMTAT